MKRWTLLLLLLLTSTCRCDTPPASPGGPGGISLAGKKLRTLTFSSGIGRSRIPDALNPLEDDQAAVVGYDRPRHIHLYGEALATDFDIVFLDTDRRVVETSSLASGTLRGVTATRPAKYAVLLRAGWISDHDLRVGSEASIESPDAQEPEPLSSLEIEGNILHVELARSHKERSRGLMYRRHLSWDEGMLFCYEGEEPHTFWMRNTWVPLDIAFLRSDGEILNVAEAPVWEDPEHGDGPRPGSSGPCRYVLEVNLGWFRRHDLLDASGRIKPGIRAEIPEEARRNR